MGKFNLFVSNFVVYGLGSVFGKIIPLLMVPIITRLMPDTFYYGINDLCNIVIAFASALAILGMYDSLFRFYFDDKDIKYRTSLCSTALLFVMGLSLFLSIIIVVFADYFADLVFKNTEYTFTFLIYIVAAATFVSAVSTIVAAPTRMENKSKLFLCVNTVSPLLGYGISIPMLLCGYYLFALPVASLLSSFIVFLIFSYLNRGCFSYKTFSSHLLKKMLGLALPIAPVFLIYWIFNSLDRMMIADMLTIAETGQYAIGSKLGQASQLVYMAFAGGWQYFAFSTMNDNNQVVVNSRIFEYLGIVSFIGMMFICAITYDFHKLIFTGDYVLGYMVSPYLFFSPLLLMLYQVIANQLLVRKISWPRWVILPMGVIINASLNYLLIPVLGIEGAGIATMCGYIGIVVTASLILIHLKLMTLRPKFIIASLILIAFIICWRFLFREDTFIGITSAFVVSTLIIFLYYEDVKPLFKRIVNSF